MPAQKKFTIEERVRWGDVDAARIIFYGAYIRFFEFAETELFREVGLHYGKMFDELGIWLPRVHVECDFLHPVTLDELLMVDAFFGRIGQSSVHLNFEVRAQERPDVVAATGKYILVTVKQGTFKPVPVPDVLREKLARYVEPELKTL